MFCLCAGCVFWATSHVVDTNSRTAPSRGVGENDTGGSENTPVRRTPRISPMTFPLGCEKERFIWMWQPYLNTLRRASDRVIKPQYCMTTIKLSFSMSGYLEHENVMFKVKVITVDNWTKVCFCFQNNCCIVTNVNIFLSIWNTVIIFQLKTLLQAIIVNNCQYKKVLKENYS